jgi:PEP-CTERM motif
MTIRHIAAATLLALSAAHAVAADPTASLNKSFVEYTDAGPIGNNNINESSFFWMKEQAGSWMGQQVQSWFLIWDPKKSEQVKGSVTFDADILAVLDSKAELQASAAFEKAGVTYNYSRSTVGLEHGESRKTSFADDTLSLKWTASSPGDHVRVMTAVPEPGTYALMAAGLAMLGVAARRRKA